MSSASEPVWLKIMEHGATGEARTKAFLLDRFWVMERSVDIDGADFLIQLRSLSTRFTDASPPRVGIVQAKYYQDRATTQYIPCHYVVDDRRAAFLALSGRIKEELIAKVSGMYDEAEKKQRYFASLSFDRKTLAFERIRVKLLDAEEAKPKRQFSAVRSVSDHFDKKCPAIEVADHLWHVLATDVLKFVCPNLEDEED